MASCSDGTGWQERLAAVCIWVGGPVHEPGFREKSPDRGGRVHRSQVVEHNLCCCVLARGWQRCRREVLLRMH